MSERVDLTDRWPAGATDTLAFRAKVGVVVPATNTIVQPELEAMRPPGVTNHVTRMLLPPRPYDDMAVYRRALETEQGNLEDALRLLLPCEPHVVAHGHSIHSFRGDLARAQADAAALAAFCGRPFITPSTAVVRGLEALGNPRRLGVLTPYWPPAGELVAAFFRSAGYAVARLVNMEARGPTNVGKIGVQAILDAFDQLAGDDVDAFVHVGTALPVSALTPAIEQRHGRPLVGVNVATYWAALRAIGLPDRVQGFGRLFAEC
jgi:maleate isomerase